jgi:hypothetical protein
MLGRYLAFIFWLSLAIVQLGCTAQEVDETTPVTPTATDATLTIAPFSVSESTGGQFQFVLSKALTSQAAFMWTISQITASPTGRFTALSSVAVIPAGVTSFSVPIPLVNDTIYQQDQDFKLTLSGASRGIVIPTPSITFRVLDDDTQPKVGFAIASQSLAENLGPATVTLTLSNPSNFTTSVTYSLSGTATSPSDYSVSPATTVTFAPLQVSQSISVPFVNDSIPEPDETVIFSLGTATGGTVDATRQTHTLTIVNDDGPLITQVTSSKTNGIYNSGTIAITVQFSQTVAVTGTPVLKLETGAIDRNATYVSGSGTTTLTFNYTIQSGDTSNDLDYWSTSALSGGTIKDVATSLNAQLGLPAPGSAGSLGANKDLIIDTTPPSVTNVSSVTADGSYKQGATILVTVAFTEPVVVTGSPTFLLETGTTDEAATYTSGSGTSTLTFTYTVQNGDSTFDLDEQSSAALALNGGSIRDSALNDALVAVPVPGAAGSLGANKAILIDTVPPTVLNVTSSTTNGWYPAGTVIPIQVSFSKNVFVTGTPQITMKPGASGRAINYSSGSGSSSLVFNYTVQSGDTTALLDYVATTSLALNGGTILDAASNPAVLTLAAPGATGSLSISKSLSIDTDLPTTPSSVLDGTFTTLTTQAPTTTWGASTDATSGVEHYDFAIGTTAGGSDVVPWTPNALTLSRTQTSLTLTEGTIYYASVRAVDRAGNKSTVASGDGFRADATAPTMPATLDDGITSALTTQSPTLTWAASTDAVSGLARYEVAIGTSSGASDVLSWTGVGLVTSKVVTGLALTEGQTYFASVRAVDQAGNVSAVRAGDGWTIGWLQQAYLKAVNNHAADAFGGSIAISGDTMVVGVPSESSNSTSIINGATASSDHSAAAAGAVFVYVRTGTTWTQQAYLKAGNGAAGDQFGKSVAISGDTIVVGAPFEDGTATSISTTFPLFRASTDTGAVYIYKRTGTTWAMEAYAKASNARNGDNYGSAVAIDLDTIVVGSPHEASNTTGTSASSSLNTSLPNAGAGYVLVRSGTTWSEQSYLKAARAVAVGFGSSVSISVDTIAIGAPLDSSNRTTITNGTGGSSNTSQASAGGAYAFTRSGVTWTQEAYIKPSNNTAGNKFGSSIAVSGNLIVVGAPFEDSNAQGASATPSADTSSTDSGAAYVYSRSGTTWSEESYLKAANSSAGAHFGTSVGLDGSLALVGSPDENANDTTVTQGSTASSNSSAASAGAAYLYRRSGTAWSELAYLKAPNTDSGDAFGGTCAISGSSLAVGAALEDSAQTTITNGATASAGNTSADSGAVYLFNR